MRSVTVVKILESLRSLYLAPLMRSSPIHCPYPATPSANAVVSDIGPSATVVRWPIMRLRLAPLLRVSVGAVAIIGMWVSLLPSQSTIRLAKLGGRNKGPGRGCRPCRIRHRSLVYAAAGASPNTVGLMLRLERWHPCFSPRQLELC